MINKVKLVSFFLFVCILYTAVFGLVAHFTHMSETAAMFVGFVTGVPVGMWAAGYAAERWG